MGLFSTNREPWYRYHLFAHRQSRGHLQAADYDPVHLTTKCVAELGTSQCYPVTEERRVRYGVAVRFSAWAQVISGVDRLLTAPNRIYILYKKISYVFNMLLFASVI